MKIFQLWATPLVIAGVIFLLVRPAFAEFVQQQTVTSTNILEVGSEKGRDGYRQIYYTTDTGKVFITDTLYTNAAAHTDGVYISWMGQVGDNWQIFLYNILSHQKIQLTHTGNNVNPRVDNGRVVWEGWVEDRWQVFFFDGTSLKQLTSGDLSLHPDIEGDQIVFARSNKGEWRAEKYSISTGNTVLIDHGLQAKHPWLLNGNILFGQNRLKRRPAAASQATPFEMPEPDQSASDSAVSTITEEEMRNELLPTVLPTQSFSGAGPSPAASPSASMAPSAGEDQVGAEDVSSDASSSAAQNKP